MILLVIAAGILFFQVLSLGMLPVFWLWLRNRNRKFCLEEVWVLIIIAACLQAATGTFWSILIPYPALGQLGLWVICGVGLGEFWHWKSFPCQPLQSKSWMWTVVGLAFSIRMLPVLLHSSLGQSDAYSHLQFGMEILEKGRLNHHFYPTGYSWVNALPLMIFPAEPYYLYRFGGALPGLGLVLGIFFATRQAASEKAAYCAALLVSGFPLLLPLIKTGVGVYPNQFGLCLVPFIVWAFPKRFGWGLVGLMALGLSVPVMMVDLLPVFMIYLFVQREFRRLTVCMLTALLGATLITLQLLHLSSEHLELTLFLFTNDTSINTLHDLALHYFSVKPFVYDIPIHIAIGSIAASSCFLFLSPSFRKKENVLLILLTVYSGLQTALGVFQFANYQRAGWIFLTGFCMISGWFGWELSKKMLLSGFVRPLLALSCCFLLVSPVSHEPQLSKVEDELIQFLYTLSQNPPPEKVFVWSRSFNNFSGRQGDPVQVFLRDRNHFRFQILSETSRRKLHPDKPSIVILEKTSAPETGNLRHDEEVLRLYKQNQFIEKELERIPEKKLLPDYLPLLEVWYWPPDLFSTPDN